jgi:hypothetical protein
MIFEKMRINISVKFVANMGRKLSTSLDNFKFETLKVTNPHEFVFHVQMNRPEKRNAMNPTFFKYNFY